DTAVTQTPKSLPASAGGRITINCKTSASATSSNGNRLNWYQQKPASTLVSGVPAWFSGSGSGTDFTLPINGVEADDAADYCCQHTYNTPHTICPGGTILVKKGAV
uniref:Ig-like domain-containing protein n=1 Tax=Ornithorhynchus anatinus TaxID=9258 RepID=A0A6I8N4V6_ORNAN